MKSVAILALAAGVQATGWLHAPPFNCPGKPNVPPKTCPPGTIKQSYTFEDSKKGFFEDMDFNLWEQRDDTKRDRLGRRTGGKHLVAECSKDKSPSFGCKSGKCDDFDLDEVHVKPEFDCDLDFHYEMPDGKECKQRHSCSKGGSIIKNTQCAGAKKCTVKYPPKPEKPKCSVTMSTIKFSCVSTTTSAIRTTTTSTRPTTTPRVITTTTTASTLSTTTSTICRTCRDDTTSTSATTSPTSSAPTSAPTTTTSPAGPGVDTTTTSAGTTTTSPAGPGVDTTTTSATTSTSTPGSFGNSTTTTTTSPAGPGVSTTTTTSPAGPGVDTTTSGSDVSSTTTPGGVATTTTGGPEGPKETLPCPEVVPKCLNTFMFTVGCKDNTDHGCFCPDEIFVKNVFTCFYAHGESDSIVSEAIIYFQGLCAPYCPGNPAIVGPSITSYITPTVTATIPGATYTTVIVTKTEVVPCTGPAGEASSTTTTIVASATVPQVGLTSAGPSGTDVAIVPVAQITTAAPIGSAAPSVKPTQPSAGLPAAPKPTGVVVAGSGRATASLGLAGVVAVFAAFML